jgi:hypothetical protein
LKLSGGSTSVTTGVLKSIIIQLLHDETEVDDSPCYCPGKSDELALHARKTTRLTAWAAAYRRATGRYEVSGNHSDRGVNKLETVKCEAFRSDLRSLLNQHLVALPSRPEEVVRLSFLREKVSENFQPSPRIHLAP